MHVIIQPCLLFIWLHALNSVNAEGMTCYHGNGRNYRGTVARTISGKICQSWSAQTPHSHEREPDNYPCKGLDNNYCRNPDNERMPWCYTTDSQTRWEYCDVPRCDGVPEPASEPAIPELTCFTCDGVNYRGTASKTISGETCQSWSAQTPHSHVRTPENHPHDGLDENYCRNPDNEMRPWCYTTNSQKRWEYCEVARCDAVPQPDLSCYSGIGIKYRGTVARTISGKTCQSWSAQTPHSHGRTPDDYPCKGLDHNYCRNPDNERMPWCYTTDSQTRWEYCDVPTCDGVVPEPASEPTIAPELTCFNCEGVNYRGTVARTISGKPCQRWSAQTPHPHQRTPQNHPQEGLDSNYCRNPDNEKMPWCYTTDPQTRWEYCQIPRCPETDSSGTRPVPVQFSECGRPRLSLMVRVFGGKLSGPGDHPWQASLQRRTAGSTEPFTHACGGALIASCWVLTAAHCIEDYMDMQVVLGTVDITRHGDDVQVISVERAIVHKEYRRTMSNTAHNDVALLQLKVTDSPFCAKESEYVKTACLPNQHFPVGKVCKTSGWGSTEHLDRPDKLSYVNIPLMSKQQCVEMFAGRGLDSGLLDDTMICAGDLLNRVDTCQGDSGGPLICRDDDGVHYITGVVSWGKAECGGHRNIPGIYADVHRYVTWIHQIMS